MALVPYTYATNGVASLAALSAIDAPEYGVEGSRVTYEGGAAGFYRAESASTYEQDDVRRSDDVATYDVAAT